MWPRTKEEALSTSDLVEALIEGRNENYVELRGVEGEENSKELRKNNTESVPRKPYIIEDYKSSACALVQFKSFLSKIIVESISWNMDVDMEIKKRKKAIDTRKNIAAEFTNLRIKIILNSSNSYLNLEQWQVMVESTERKVKRLKSEDIFLIF